MARTPYMRYRCVMFFCAFMIRRGIFSIGNDNVSSRRTIHKIYVVFCLKLLTNLSRRSIVTNALSSIQMPTPDRIEVSRRFRGANWNIENGSFFLFSILSTLHRVSCPCDRDLQTANNNEKSLRPTFRCAVMICARRWNIAIIIQRLTVK